MQPEEFDIPFEENAEETALVQRYEAMISTNGSDYFDEEEFEIIINHYFDLGKPADALAAADYGNRQHPFSCDMKLQYAHALIQKGERQQALQLLRKMEAEAVNDPEVFFLKGLAYLRDNTLNEALRSFDKAVKKAIDNDECIAFLMSAGSALLEVHEYKFALPYIQKALTLAPGDLEIVNEIAFCHERLGNLEESRAYHEQYIKDEPYNANVWYNLGTIYGRQGNFDKAAQAFQFTITLNEQFASAYYNLAATYQHLERYTEAIDMFNMFLQMEPDSPDAYFAIGECYDFLDRNTEAIAAFSKAIELDDEFADAHFFLSLSYTKDDLIDEAFHHIHMAIALVNDYAVYWFELAVLFYITDSMENFFASVAKGLDLDMQAWGYFAERCPEAAQNPKIQLLYTHCKQLKQPN